MQFWDKGHLIAAQVKQQLEQFHGSDPSCCEDRGHLWDMAAVYPPGVKWGETKPAFDDGPVYRIAPTLEEKVVRNTLPIQRRLQLTNENDFECLPSRHEVVFMVPSTICAGLGHQQGLELQNDKCKAAVQKYVFP